MPSSLPDDLPESIRESVEAVDRAAAGRQSDPFVILQQENPNKYLYRPDFEIDCENRLDRCKAACCRLAFPLSQQDLDEGVVRFDPSAPYVIAQDETRTCVHLDSEHYRCNIYCARPLPCRAFDCRHDPRIWIDFERGEVNPAVQEPDWPFSATTEQPST